MKSVAYLTGFFTAMLTLRAVENLDLSKWGAILLSAFLAGAGLCAVEVLAYLLGKSKED